MSSPESAAPAPREVRCPACGGPSLYALSNPHRPFCGPRCKNADLGAWANEEFKLEATPSPEDGPDLPPILQ